MDSQTQDTPNVTPPTVDATPDAVVVLDVDSPTDVTPPGALGPGAAATEAMLAAALSTDALLDRALSQTTSRGIRKATDRAKDLATIGDVRDAARLVARHLLETMRVTSNALGDGVASLGQMLEDEAKAARARTDDVDGALGTLAHRIDNNNEQLGAALSGLRANLSATNDRIDDMLRAFAALQQQFARDGITIMREVDGVRDAFRRFEAVNLATHNAAQRRIARLERSAWARTVAFVVRWWGVARGRFCITGTP